MDCQPSNLTGTRCCEPTSILVELWFQALRFEGLGDLVGDVWRARRIVLQLVALGREAVVVVEERVLLGVGDGGIALRPVGGDEDDGAGLFGGAQLENIRHPFPQRLDDLVMLGIAEDGHGPATVGDADDRSAGHAGAGLVGLEVEGLLLDFSGCCAWQYCATDGGENRGHEEQRARRLHMEWVGRTTGASACS